MHAPGPWDAPLDHPEAPEGLRDDAASHSWNSSHPSRGPGGRCTPDDLNSTGRAGLMYFFAAYSSKFRSAFILQASPRFSYERGSLD